MKQYVSIKNTITELSTENSGFYGVRFGALGEPYITFYKDRFNVLCFDAKTCSKVFGFIHRTTVITIEISCQTLKVNFFSKGTEQGTSFAVVINDTDYSTRHMTTQDALVLIKRELISNCMDKLLELPSRRRKALCVMLWSINDEHVTKYKIGSRYKLIKHRGRLRLLFGDTIASDVNCIEELTKDMFVHHYPALV